MNKVEITKVLQEIIWQMDFALLKHGEDYFMEFIDDNDLGYFFSDLYLDDYKDGFTLFRRFCSKMLVFDVLLDRAGLQIFHLSIHLTAMCNIFLQQVVLPNNDSFWKYSFYCGHHFETISCISHCEHKSVFLLETHQFFFANH